MNKTLALRATELLTEFEHRLRQTTGTGKLRNRVARLISDLRMINEDMEKNIRILAERGEGCQSICKILGISKWKLDQFRAVMPDLKFAAHGQTAGEVRGRLSNLGQYTPNRKIAHAKAIAASVEKRRVHEMCGVRGTILELYNLWKEHTSVSYAQAKRRMQDGDHIYKAFFDPKRPSARDMPGPRRKPWEFHKERIKQELSA